MCPDTYNEILTRLRPHISKKNNRYRKAIPAGLKLCITIRHLASGDSYRSLAYQFRVPHNTISKLVREVCDAFIHVYKQEVIKTPRTPEDWKEIAEGFSAKWNFHHTLGALDGKHVRIKCPKHAGSKYFNYKKYHSLVLMAMVDSKYRFIWVDVGAHGSMSDSQIFNDTFLCKAIHRGNMGFPPPEPLPHDTKDMPYFIVGDNIFGLKTWLMKPYSHL